MRLIDLIGEGVLVDPNRRLSFVVGLLFVITYLTAIPPAFFLYSPVLDDPNYIVGAGADTRIALGTLLELILIITNVGTASGCSRSSSGSTKRSLSAMSQLASLNAASSPSASSASYRS